MPTRFMTDPHEMRSMAGRFDVHAQTVEDEEIGRASCRERVLMPV